jgi:hypothetical protein
MPGAVDTSREDPLIGFHFALDVQGEIAGYFTEVSGIGSETEVERRRNSLENTRPAEVGRYHPEARNHLEPGSLEMA